MVVVGGKFLRGQGAMVPGDSGKQSGAHKEGHTERVDARIGCRAASGAGLIPEALSAVGTVGPGLVLQGPGLLPPLFAADVAQDQSHKRDEGENGKRDGQTQPHNDYRQGPPKALLEGEIAAV